MLLISTDRPALAETLRRKGFRLQGDTWVAIINGEPIIVPDDLDKWQKGEPPQQPA